MRVFHGFSLLLICFLLSCSIKEPSDSFSNFPVYCEMVAHGAKPIAFSDPMDSSTIREHIKSFEEIANSFDLLIHIEDQFPNTLLFPQDVTGGKSIIIIYQGDRLIQYQQWREDHLAISKDDHGKQIATARRLGRLLGYNNEGINTLLSENTDHRALSMFGVQEQITHLYYEDVNEAIAFYTNILGLTPLENSRFQLGEDVFLQINPLNEDHTEDQPKSIAIALLTDQLPGWYTHIQEKGVPIKYTYKPKPGGPHDGFVAIDPGGYLLEFEQFKQHPENELFMAALSEVNTINTTIGDLGFYGSITWTYHRDLLKMQEFYEEVLGYTLVADQGWTKIYQTSSSGFIGLVDECRGMENYADHKAVEIEWVVKDYESFDSYASKQWELYGYGDGGLVGPERYSYKIQ